MRITKSFKFDAKEVAACVATIRKNATEREALTKAFSVDAMQIAKEGKAAEFQKALGEYSSANANFDLQDANSAGYLIRLIQYLGSENLSPFALAQIVEGTSQNGDYNLSVQRANKTLRARREAAKAAKEKKEGK